MAGWGDDFLLDAAGEEYLAVYLDGEADQVLLADAFGWRVDGGVQTSVFVHAASFGEDMPVGRAAGFLMFGQRDGIGRDRLLEA